MRSSLFILLILLSACNSNISTSKQERLSDVPNSKNTQSNLIDMLITDLNFDDLNDTLELSVSPSGDPGLFREILFKISNSKAVIFEANDAWDTIDEEFLEKNNNDISSEHVFIKKYSNYSLVILMGWRYGSGREDFTIFKIIGDSVRKIFDKPYDIIGELVDLNSDNYPEIIVRNHWEVYIPVDSLDANIGTYSPFHIYSIGNDEVYLDTALTISYNKKYYVFKGLNYDNDIKILYPRKNGVPTLFE
ncbi:MAG: hypothetical protein HOM80_09280 [Bacteroidetes bacterium]|nr:hypothetical protein [Bacteroidota bacterium]